MLFSQDLLRCIARANPTSPIFWACVYDSSVEKKALETQQQYATNFDAVAMVSRYPDDAIRPLGMFFRLMPTTVIKRWKSLGSCLGSLETARMAFYETHGPFLVLHAISEIYEHASGGSGGLGRDHNGSVQHIGNEDSASPSIEEPETGLLNELQRCATIHGETIYAEARPHQRLQMKARSFKDIMVFRGPNGHGPSIHMMMWQP